MIDGTIDLSRRPLYCHLFNMDLQSFDNLSALKSAVVKYSEAWKKDRRSLYKPKASWLRAAMAHR